LFVSFVLTGQAIHAGDGKQGLGSGIFSNGGKQGKIISQFIGIYVDKKGL